MSKVTKSKTRIINGRVLLFLTIDLGATKIHKKRSIENMLTARERMVLPLIVSGKTNKEIAAVLNIADRTVRFHASSLYQKNQHQKPNGASEPLPAIKWSS